MRIKLKYIFFVFIIFVAAIELYIRFFAGYCEPYFDKQTKILKRVKNTKGVYKTEYTSSGYFRINNEGWNSHRDYYKRESKPTNGGKRLRVAIVGHSEIEGLRVPVDQTLSKVLENDLIRNGTDAEVYTFGYGGMHIAQALHVSRFVVENYHPDILIIGALFSDFLAGYDAKQNFLSLAIDSGSRIKEILPERNAEESNSPLSSLYFLKTIKYVDLNFRLGERLNRLFKREKIEDKSFELFADTTFKYKRLIGVNYILQEFSKIANPVTGSNTKVYFISFPVNIASYNKSSDIYLFESAIQHEKIIVSIKNNQFPVIDLKKALLDDYNKNHCKFDFPNDRHYNQHAHEVVGHALSAGLTKL